MNINQGLTLGAFDFKRAAQSGQCMTSKYRESRWFLCFRTALSRDTLKSYTDRSMQRRLKSNAASLQAKSEGLG